MTDFQVGDTVELKSGSEPMSVLALYGDQARVAWFCKPQSIMLESDVAAAALRRTFTVAPAGAAGKPPGSITYVPDDRPWWLRWWPL